MTALDKLVRLSNVPPKTPNATSRVLAHGKISPSTSLDANAVVALLGNCANFPGTLNKVEPILSPPKGIRMLDSLSGVLL